MKYIKKFEAFDYSNEDELIEEIKDTVDSLVYDHETYEDFDPNDYPELKTELAVISYRKEIEDVYNAVEPANMSLEDFTILYNKIIEESEKKVINYLIKHPFKSIDNITSIIDLPQWVIDTNKILNKYNI